VRPEPVQTGVEKKKILVSPGFETATVHLVGSLYIDYPITE
jgi:hypothetical protein